MATDVFGEKNTPQGLQEDQIQAEASKNNGFVNCGGKKLKARVTHEESESEKADFWIFSCRSLTITLTLSSLSSLTLTL